jgi:gas vesicle protein
MQNKLAAFIAARSGSAIDTTRQSISAETSIALRNQISSVLEMIEETTDTHSEITKEIERRLKRLSDELDRLPAFTRDRLERQLLGQKEFRAQIEILTKFCESVEAFTYFQEDQAQQIATTKTSQIKGIMLGLIVGLVVSMACAPFIKTSDEHAARDIGGTIAAVSGLFTAGGYFWTLPNQGKRRRT